jgi:hypothetical protein
MKLSGVLFGLIFVFVLPMGAQPPQTLTSAKGQARAESRHEMTEMHQQEMEAMKAEIKKMKASLAEMKANTYTIKDVNELARWRNNVEMWEALLGHMERMQKQMESMGPGVMGSHKMGAEAAPPDAKKPD